MAKLSEKLADLSARVGDIEARAEAFRAAQQDKRDQTVAELKADIEAQQNKIQSAVQAKGDEISSAWSSFNSSVRNKASTVRAQIEAKKDAIDASRAGRRADRLEYNAMLTVDFALAAMDEAELAVIESIDARAHSDKLAASNAA